MIKRFTEDQAEFACDYVKGEVMCTYDDKGFKPCELQAIDCEGCEYSEVQE